MLSKEEELAAIHECIEEATQMDIDALTNTEAVQNLLAQPESKEFAVYKFGSVEIRYRPALTSRLRSLLKTAKKKSEMEGADALAIQDRLVYDGLAELCVDAPYDNPVTWAAVDLRSKDGRVYNIFREMMTEIGAGEQAVKTFR